MSSTHPLDLLLVEDEAADLSLMQRAAADCSPQLRMWTVARGHEALAFLRHEPPFVHSPTPALILLDLAVPGLDGYTLLAELRTLPAYHMTPVSIVSGNERRVEAPRCLQLGATAYVQTSSDFASYFHSIQALLREWLGGACAPRYAHRHWLGACKPRRAAPIVSLSACSRRSVSLDASTRPRRMNWP